MSGLFLCPWPQLHQAWPAENRGEVCLLLTIVLQCLSSTTALTRRAGEWSSIFVWRLRCSGAWGPSFLVSAFIVLAWNDKDQGGGNKRLLPALNWEFQWVLLFFLHQECLLTQHTHKHFMKKKFRIRNITVPKILQEYPLGNRVRPLLENLHLCTIYRASRGPMSNDSLILALAFWENSLISLIWWGLEMARYV